MGALGGDPISQLIGAGAGEAFSITTAAGSSSAAYDPASNVDFVPGADTTLQLTGIFSDLYDEHMPQGAVASVLFPGARPAGLMANVTRATRAATGITYRVVKIRERVWLGATNGFNLYLAL